MKEQNNEIPSLKWYIYKKVLSYSNFSEKFMSLELQFQRKNFISCISSVAISYGIPISPNKDQLLQQLPEDCDSMKLNFANL